MTVIGQISSKTVPLHAILNPVSVSIKLTDKVINTFNSKSDTLFALRKGIVFETSRHLEDNETLRRDNLLPPGLHICKTAMGLEAGCLQFVYGSTITPLLALQDSGFVVPAEDSDYEMSLNIIGDNLVIEYFTNVKSIKLAENIDNGSSSSDQLRTSISPVGFNNRDDCVRYNIFNPIVLWLMYIGIDVNDIVLKYFSTE